MTSLPKTDCDWHLTTWFVFSTGVDAGSRLRVRGEGNVGRRGGEPGDLYVFISVKPHPAGLKREGTTIHSDVDISFVDAILGTTVKVWPGLLLVFSIIHILLIRTGWHKHMFQTIQC